MAAALLERPSLLLFTVVVGGLTIVWGTIQSYLPGLRRRERFTVVRGFFLSLPVSSPGLNAVLGLIGLHVLAILFYMIVRRRNLTVAMITGFQKTQATGSAAATRARRWRLIPAIAAGALLVWWIAGGARF